MNEDRDSRGLELFTGFKNALLIEIVAVIIAYIIIYSMGWTS